MNNNIDYDDVIKQNECRYCRKVFIPKHIKLKYYKESHERLCIKNTWDYKEEQLLIKKLAEEKIFEAKEKSIKDKEIAKKERQRAKEDQQKAKEERQKAKEERQKANDERQKANEILKEERQKANEILKEESNKLKEEKCKERENNIKIKLEKKKN